MWGGLLQDTVSPLGDMVHLFVYSLPHKQFFSYLAAVTITGCKFWPILRAQGF
jgi:hypothetical protein